MSTTDLPLPVVLDPDLVEDEYAAPVASLSPSRAADFMSCPLLYRFRVIDHLPEAPSPAATRGTVVHAVLERLFDLPATDRTLARATELVRPEWERLLEAEPELAALLEPDLSVALPDSAEPGGSADSAEPGGADALPGFLDGAPGLLERYFELEDPQRLEPAERELRVEVELASGLVLRGFVDRLDVAPSGDLRVVDYKTGRAPGVGFEAKAMFQMRFYALVLWRAYGRVPRLLQLLYLGSGEVLRYEPDEGDLRATEVKVQALWEAIARATESGDWRPNPSRLCDWCSHRETHCPAWGGTLPPLPDLATSGSPSGSAPGKP
jgi:putative RecB family exonuclease